ncbi:MAG TPA: hypothetical protein VMA96_06285 [Solirubrobacteraceae bacterium]|nr:hypothetical protein [Solirubrobacteraceae bacterium]
MSISESVQLASPAGTTARSRALVPLVVVLAIGAAVLVVLLSLSTGAHALHHVAGTAPHIAR